MIFPPNKSERAGELPGFSLEDCKFLDSSLQVLPLSFRYLEVIPSGALTCLLAGAQIRQFVTGLLGSTGSNDCLLIL